MEQRKSLGKEAGEKKKKTVSQTQVFLLTLIFFLSLSPNFSFFPIPKAMSSVFLLRPRALLQLHLGALLS